MSTQIGIGGLTALAIGTTPITSGTVGRILFEGTGNVLQESANLFWNNANGRLGIGNAAPTRTLDITGDLNVSSVCILRGLTVSEAGNVHTLTAQGTSASIRLISNSNTLTLVPTGNVLIGTTTDAGYKLDVNGSTRIKGTGTTSATTAFRVQDSTETDIIFVRDDGRVGIRNSAPAYPLDVSGTGRITTFYTQLVLANNNFLDFRSGGGNSLNQIIFQTSASQNPTSGDTSLVNALSTFAPTTGTATYATLLANPTINQTGGANGISRGLYIAPTLTAAADFRAIETTVGKVCLNTTSGNTMIGTTTDAGYKLDVNGTARVQGNTTVTGFLSLNSFLTLTPAINGNVIQGTQTIEYRSGGSSASRNYHWFTNANAFTSTVDEMYHVLMSATFSPTSGTAGYNQLTIYPVINQTGGANGVTRGLLIQPTLTAAANWRAIEISSGGVYVNTTSVAASSILQADSTTQGFLPPRMTNAQRLAIASPAVGLIVYCTDVVEGLYINKSTGWTFVI